MDRVRSCGMHGVNPAGSVRVRGTGSGGERRAGFSGLASCGSVWACPVCSERILSGRSAEIAEALSAWTSGGGSIALVTLTMRHRRGQRLADLWNGLSYAWGKVTSGRGWGELCERYGSERLASGKLARRIGYARVVETTHGANGWHVHVHVALFLPGSVTVDQVDDLGGAMFAAWSRALQRKGFAAPTEAHGVDAKLWGLDATGAFLGDYFAKNVYDVDLTRAALELARGDLKTARGGNRTPFRILSDFVELGVADDLDLWMEWEKSSQGRRQLTWSTGLRAALLIDAERTDEELAAEELGSAADDLVEIDAAGWLTVTNFGLQSFILDAAESDDSGDALRRYLAARGITWRDVGAVRV